MQTPAFVLAANVTWEPCSSANGGQPCATGVDYAGSGIEPDT
jgi:hypothetical protein